MPIITFPPIFLFPVYVTLETPSCTTLPTKEINNFELHIYVLYFVSNFEVETKYSAYMCTATKYQRDRVQGQRG